MVIVGTHSGEAEEKARRDGNFLPAPIYTFREVDVSDQQLIYGDRPAPQKPRTILMIEMAPSQTSLAITHVQRFQQGT